MVLLRYLQTHADINQNPSTEINKTAHNEFSTRTHTTQYKKKRYIQK
jgi:hypothetical protein